MPDFLHKLHLAPTRLLTHPLSPHRGAKVSFCFDIHEGRRPVDRTTKRCVSGELAEEAKVVTVEEADIFNAVLEHGDARRP